MANSDDFGSFTYDTDLISPVINILPGAENVTLYYKVNYQNVAGQDFLDVDITTNGGMTWTNVLSWNEDHGGFFVQPGEDVTLVLDPYLMGKTSFQFRFRYHEQINGFDWYAQIDDVQVTYCGEEPIIPTLSQWGIIFLSVVLMIIGTVALKHRRIVSKI